jgi:hypothetical protein
VVGFLDAGSAAERVPQVAAFRKGLAEGGYQDGRNVALEFAWAEGQYARFAELAGDLDAYQGIFFGEQGNLIKRQRDAVIAVRRHLVGDGADAFHLPIYRL